jgi:GNAT superfamily N-acetyltransferase
MSLEIREVVSPKDRKTFIFLPEKINAGRPNWVHPLYVNDRKYFDPAKNKAFGFCDTLLLLAWKDGRPVGRVMGIVNRKFNEHRKVTMARFAFLETFEDREVFAALLRKVEDWARAKGMTRIIGPYGFSDQDPEGWLTEGFEHRATIATLYNFEWMPAFIEAEGYVKDVDYFVYKIAVPKVLPEFYHKIFERIKRRGQFELLEFKTRKEIKPFVRPVLSLMNECYVSSNIYGYHPLDEQEMDELAKSYLPVLDPRFVKVVRKDGALVAFVIGMPDMTAGIQKARGRLLPFGFLYILRAAKKTKQLDLLLGGIREDLRGLGLDVFMGFRMIQAAQEAGFEIMDTHHELESNVKVRAEMEKMGGQIYKKYRVWQKAL